MISKQKTSSLLNRAINSEKILIKEVKTFVKSTSVEECFYLTKSLLGELCVYRAHLVSGKRLDAYDVYSSLVNSPANFKDISREDCLFILSIAPDFLAKYLICNPSLPIDILVDDKYFTRFNEGSTSRHFWESLEIVRKIDRREEVIDYARSLVADSEQMTDEMVLRIVGF